VAIARAIVTEPHLILAEEPVSMLDVSVRAGVLETLRELASRRDRAMIYITHDLGTVGFICDRLLVLREGRSVETGPCRNILEEPRAEYYARSTERHARTQAAAAERIGVTTLDSTISTEGKPNAR
jgi:ABC-type glutathione transport system ATPase component